MRDCGLLTFYKLTNSAQNGDMPVETYVSAGTSFYAEKTVGFNRFWTARGANAKIDMIVRCLGTLSIPDDVEYVQLEDGKKYRIEQAQNLVNDDCVELSLARLSNYYDV